MLVILVLFLSLTGCLEQTNSEIETRLIENNIEWKYVSDDSWNHLVNLEDFYFERILNSQWVVNNSGNLKFIMNGETFELITKDNFNLNYVDKIYLNDKYEMVCEYINGETTVIDLNIKTNNSELDQISISINDQGELIITHHNGVSRNLGNIKGVDEKQGMQGPSGLQGPTGPQGSTGEPGENGLSAYQLYLLDHLKLYKEFIRMDE